MSELGPTVTELEPTAIERLRALLDERGVEWRGGLPTETLVEADGLDLLYVALPDGRVRAFIRNYLTPEQAIEATMGRGTCKYDFVPNIGNGFLNACGLKCSCCGREQMSMDAPKFCPNCGRKVVTNG